MTRQNGMLSTPQGPPPGEGKAKMAILKRKAGFQVRMGGTGSVHDIEEEEAADRLAQGVRDEPGVRAHSLQGEVES